MHGNDLCVQLLLTFQDFPWVPEEGEGQLSTFDVILLKAISSECFMVHVYVQGLVYYD